MKRWFLVIGIICFSGTASPAAEPVAGRWEGSVQIPDRELRLIVDLAPGENGKWIGSVIVPGFDVKGKQVNDLAVRGSDVSFAITTGRGLQATLKGKVSGDSFSGDFVEAGNTARFTLKKTGAPQVEQPVPSTQVDKGLEGEWKGRFELYGYARNVTITLTNHDNGGATAEYIVVGRRTTNIPVDLVKQEGTFLTIDSHEMGLGYEGICNSDRSEIKGNFVQGTIEIPLVLHRTK